jgi:hypothetical protein
MFIEVVQVYKAARELKTAFLETDTVESNEIDRELPSTFHEI